MWLIATVVVILLLMWSYFPRCKYCNGRGCLRFFLGEQWYECEKCEYMWKK